MSEPDIYVVGLTKDDLFNLLTLCNLHLDQIKQERFLTSEQARNRDAQIVSIRATKAKLHNALIKNV